AVPFTIGKLLDYSMLKMGLQVQDSQILRFMSALSKETLFGGLAAVFALGGFANFWRIKLMERAGAKIVEGLKNKVFENILRQDVVFFDAARSGEISARIASDSAIVGHTVTQNLSDGLRKGCMATVGLGMMLYVNTRLTITMTAIIPPVAVAAIAFGRSRRKLAEKTSKAASDSTSLVQEKLDAIRTVRAFAQESRESSNYAQLNHQVFDLAMKEASAAAWFYGGAGFSGNLIAMSILYYGGSLVGSGAITPGELTSFFMYSTYLGYSLMGIMSFYGELNKGVGATGRLFEFLEAKGVDQGGKKLENAQGKIEFKAVEFAYPSRPDAPIFQDLNFTIPAGSNVAIVGKSGSGKSSIASLLLRFYDPANGSVLIDGHDLRTLDANYLRDNVIAFVSQEPTLFATTIRENIAYGRPTASQAQIESAARQAHAYDFIQSTPSKFETYVGERGIALSGGQKQRIAIARALIKNPKILVFDEATSALDYTTEALVQESLAEVVKAQGRTVVTIAHRLSTIQQADLVIVLEEGRVVQVGRYADLAKGTGKFKELMEAQLN
ncbi:ATP-binding cassette sub- B member 10, mitochondrial, partial [Rhizoclosmatium hyalinum]